MIFSHKERLFRSVLPCSLIIRSSHGLCMARSTTGEPDLLQLLFPGKRCRQMNPDFPRALDYPGSDFNDFKTDGVELCRRPLRSF